ncbi:hypothetical protein G7K_6483-t1 [Saitoella complicata NRRL Y-17804]|uniref:Uncharacterized protein n=1 Tax=Saitoella complicata (strain BCRC 22490 / CBS 7301 / JCM 7358 / NBRC 10748 / NRRL Y-17804) TaxID=698492 RepID=A0A0E9NSK9_SAICN|nr:hypothetical protein G7K_6483-t1 [Saitoella complicata NRRL Y-17804]
MRYIRAVRTLGTFVTSPSKLLKCPQYLSFLPTTNIDISIHQPVIGCVALKPRGSDRTLRYPPKSSSESGICGPV